MRAVLDRYIWTECLPTLGLSVAAFTFVLLMQRLLKLSDLVVAKGVPLLAVLKLLALALPALLPLLLPVSLLLAVLLGVGRMSAESEMTAMRACGVSLAQNLKPVLELSAAVCLVTAAISLWAQPAGVRAFKSVLYDSVKNRLSVMTQAGVFTELADGLTVYAESLDEAGTLHNLFLYLEKGQSRGAWIFAKEGRIDQTDEGFRLDLSLGEIHQTPGPASPYRRVRFGTYRLLLPLPSTTSRGADTQELPTQELLAVAKATAATRPEYALDARLEFHRRLAIPASCLVLGLIGACLGVHHSRAGKSRGMVVCLLVVLVYYSLMTAGRALGQNGVLWPSLAMWLPNLVLGTVALYAFIRKNREAPLPLEQVLARIPAFLRERLSARREVA